MSPRDSNLVYPDTPVSFEERAKINQDLWREGRCSTCSAVAGTTPGCRECEDQMRSEL